MQSKVKWWRDPLQAKLRPWTRARPKKQDPMQGNPRSQRQWLFHSENESEDFFLSKNTSSDATEAIKVLIKKPILLQAKTGSNNPKLRVESPDPHYENEALSSP